MHHSFYLGYLRSLLCFCQWRRSNRQPFRPALRLATRLLFLMVSGLLVLMGLALLATPTPAQTPETSIHLSAESPATVLRLWTGFLM